MWRSHGRWPRVEQILGQTFCGHVAAVMRHDSTASISSREDHETGVVVVSGACGRCGAPRRSYRGGEYNQIAPACHRFLRARLSAARFRSRRDGRPRRPGIGAGAPMDRRKLRARSRTRAGALGRDGSSAARARWTACTQEAPHERSTVARYDAGVDTRRQARRCAPRAEHFENRGIFVADGGLGRHPGRPRRPLRHRPHAGEDWPGGGQRHPSLGQDRASLSRRDPPHDGWRCDGHGPLRQRRQRRAGQRQARRRGAARRKATSSTWVGSNCTSTPSPFRRLQALRGWKQATA